MKRDKQPAPLIERVAELAMRLGGKHLADYGAARSRHDFTQRQLMSCLILRAYLKTTYRGVLELLAVSPPLRAALGLQDKLPTTPRSRSSAPAARFWRLPTRCSAPSEKQRASRRLARRRRPWTPLG